MLWDKYETSRSQDFSLENINTYFVSTHHFDLLGGGGNKASE